MGLSLSKGEVTDSQLEKLRTKALLVSLSKGEVTDSQLERRRGSLAK